MFVALLFRSHRFGASLIWNMSMNTYDRIKNGDQICRIIDKPFRTAFAPADYIFSTVCSVSKPEKSIKLNLQLQSLKYGPPSLLKHLDHDKRRLWVARSIFGYLTAGDCSWKTRIQVHMTQKFDNLSKALQQHLELD